MAASLAVGVRYHGDGRVRVGQIITTLVSCVVVGLESEALFRWNVMFCDSLHAKSQGLRLEMTMCRFKYGGPAMNSVG